MKYEDMIKEQSKVTLDDVYGFYEFLQGRDESGIKWGNKKGLPRLSAEQAFQVIYYLQEHLRVLPDSIERCNICGELFDYENEGFHDNEGTGKFYCDNCR